MSLLGLVKHLVGWPVTGPTYLLGFSLRQTRDAALREVADDTAVREELLELQLRLELGEIDEETYVEREAELIRRLRETREWRRRLGLPGAGGVLGMEGGPGAVGEPPADADTPERGDGTASGGDSGRRPAPPE